MYDVIYVMMISQFLLLHLDVHDLCISWWTLDVLKHLCPLNHAERQYDLIVIWSDAIDLTLSVLF